MNKFSVIILVLFSLLAQAQDFLGIKFREGSFSQAMNEAKTQNKLIFVDIYTTWCGPCKQMSAKVFSNKEVGETFNKQFINYKIDAEKGEGISLAKMHGVVAYPTYLFLNSGGELVYRAMGYLPIEKLIAESEKAFLAGKNFKSTEEFEKEYKNGRKDADFLLRLSKRKNLNGSNNAPLLNEYLKAIPESAQKTEKVLALISENIGTIETRAFLILTDALTNRYMNMTPQQQKYILGSISKAKINTLRKSIETKDKNLLEKLIGASKSTAYSQSGFEAEENHFRLEFAKATKDTEMFKKVAMKEATKLMAKNDVTLAKETQQKIASFREGAKEKNLDESTPQFKLILENLADNAEKITSFQLNDFAWGYLQLVTNLEELQQALKWAERANELVESPANLDTYAQLLNKLDRKQEAIKIAKKAIKLAKESGGNTAELEKTLKIIKD